MPSIDSLANLAYSTIESINGNGDGTALDFVDEARFPDPAATGAYNIVVKHDDGAPATIANAEIMRVTAKSGTTFTVMRDQEGTTGITVVVGDIVFITTTVENLKSAIDVEQALRCGEIKGWPTAWPDATDLITVNAWFDMVGTGVACTRVDIAGETLEAIPYSVDAIKVVTDAADEGFSQVFTYTVEPRFAAGFIAPPIAFLMGTTSGPPDVTAKLVNSDSGETEAELVKLIGADWGLYVIRGHMLSGTAATLQWTKDTAGTFYVVPLGQRPTATIYVNSSVLLKDFTGLGNEATWTDIDATSVSSALAFEVGLRVEAFEDDGTTAFDLFLRLNGSAVDITTYQRVFYLDSRSDDDRVNQPASILLDDAQIFEYYWRRFAGAGTLNSGGVYLHNYKVWA